MNRSWINNLKKDKIKYASMGFILFFSIWYFFINPMLLEKKSAKIHEWHQKQETLAWLLNTEKSYHPQAPKPKFTTAQYLSLISDQLKQSSFQNLESQFQQMASGDLDLSFPTVPFNDFMIWLRGIYEKYGLTIKELNIEKTSNPGMVRIHLIFMA